MPDPRLAASLRLAIVPAYNEEGSVGGVIDEIRAFDPGFEVVVVDDGSVDRTSAVAAEHGAQVLRLPFNLGIGGAMQTGFRAVNRRGIALFAADYPHDYPEVEATLMLVRHRLRLCEVPVTMRERSAGRSSIGAFASVYYMAKVLLGLFVGLFRKNVVPLEEQ